MSFNMPKQDLKKIIWLASYPKSGNTWFRVFLENLLNPLDDFKDINSLSSSMMASSRTLIDNYSGVSSANLTETEIDELRPKVYNSIAEQSDELFFLKVHDMWKYTPSGRPMFPGEATKGVIYIIRNPLDIAISFSHHSSNSIDKTIKNLNCKEFAFCSNPNNNHQQVKQLLSDWSGHVISWLDNSGLPTLVLRYEDMLDDPDTSFREALDFLGIRAREKEFRQAINASKFNFLKKTEEKEGFIEKPIKMESFFREGKSGNWKKHLNFFQKNEIISSHSDQMKRFGYLPHR